MSWKSAEERKADYAWYKARGICTMCKKAPAFGRFTLCAACLEESAQRSADWRAKDQERSKASLRKSYWKKRAEGRCVNCGSPEAGANCRCPTCARNERIRLKTIYVRKVKPAGICRVCDQPVHPGKKLCEEHWLKAREQLLSVRPGNDQHVWRRDDGARLKALSHRKEGMEV